MSDPFNTKSNRVTSFGTRNQPADAFLNLNFTDASGEVNFQLGVPLHKIDNPTSAKAMTGNLLLAKWEDHLKKLEKWENLSKKKQTKKAMPTFDLTNLELSIRKVEVKSTAGITL